MLVGDHTISLQVLDLGMVDSRSQAPMRFLSSSLVAMVDFLTTMMTFSEAVCLGHQDRRKMDKGRMEMSDKEETLLKACSGVDLGPSVEWEDSEVDSTTMISSEEVCFLRATLVVLWELPQAKRQQ